MQKRFVRLLNSSSHDHRGQRKLHMAFIVVALIISLASSPLLINSVGIYIFFAFLSILLATLVFAYKDNLWPARVITPIAGFLLITRLIYGGGIHDDALGGYYFILIIAGLLLGQRAMLIFGVSSALAVIAIGLAETTGLITTRFGPLTEQITISTTAFFLLGTTLGLNYMIVRLNRAIKVARRNEAAQVKANQELQELQEDLEKRVEQRTFELDFANQQLTQQFDRINSLQEKLRQEAIRDPLTGLFNRRHLDEMFQIEIARAKRSKSPITILILDIDHFKLVNDTYGHLVGDIVLQSVANTLKDNVRIGDIVCRYGGEEFVLILPGMQDNDGRKRAEVFRKLIASQPINHKGHTVNLTISIGGSVYPKNGTSEDELFSLADDALYLAKQNGRDRVEFVKSGGHLKEDHR